MFKSLKILARLYGQYGFFKTVLLAFRIALFRLGFSRYIKVDRYPAMLLRRGTSDFAVFRQIFIDGEYNIKFPTSPKSIVDLGAYIGLFSILMHKRYPEAVIYSLEPQPDNYSQLIKNTEGISNIVPLEMAIWNFDGEVEIIVENKKNAEWGAFTKSISQEDSGPHKVPSVTMESFMAMHSLEVIDLLKIDIEGAEKVIFQENFEWLQKVKILMIELHDYKNSASSNSFFKAIASLEHFDFHINGENLIFINKDYL